MIREEQFEAGQASAIPRIRELEAKNVELTNFWKPIIDKFLTKYKNAGNANVVALTALTEAFDIHCRNETLEAKNVELENQLKLSKDFVEIWRDKSIELEKKLDIAVEALSDWLKWEDKQIQKEGAYVGAEINYLIMDARQALSKIKREGL